jgi:hypothetical protein
VQTCVLRQSTRWQQQCGIFTTRPCVDFASFLGSPCGSTVKDHMQGCWRDSWVLSWPVCIWHGECICNCVDEGRRMGRVQMRLMTCTYMCDGGLGVYAVWVCFGAMLVTSLAHTVVCRRRSLSNNEISTIANGAFAGLTALQYL